MNERNDEERLRLLESFAENRDPAVRNAIVESFAPLAQYFANRYRDRGVEMADLSQVAQLGLVKAVDRFDLEQGVQFSTFAGRTIDGELKRHFRDSTWSMRVPRSLKELSIEIRQLADQRSVDLGRPPTVAELATASGYDVDRILEALDVQTAYRAQSIDRPAVGSDDGSSTVASTLGQDEAGFEQMELRDAVQSLLDTLADREREIIELRFFDDLSQSEIAERMNMSQMHVSRLLRKTFDQLRATMR